MTTLDKIMLGKFSYLRDDLKSKVIEIVDFMIEYQITSPYEQAEKTK